MKRFLFIAIMALMTFGLFQNAKAELLVEPVIGWSFDQSLKFNNAKNFSSGDGMSYGGRLGFQKLGFQVGLDYLKSQINMGSNDFDEDLDSDQWAGFVGFKFPILAKVYAGYIFSAQADSKLDHTNLKLEDGTGIKLGAGCTILPFLDVNLEYVHGTYGSRKLGGVSTSNNVDFESLMLSISLPITS